WVRAVEAHGAWVQIWPGDSHRLAAWLRGRCRRLNLAASDEALELVAARTEGNLLAAHQELTQLALLAPAGRVTPDAVLAAVADSARFDVFGLGEAVLAGETARALRVLAGLRAEGTEPTLALWALSRALRDVWSARGGDKPPARQQRHGAGLEPALRRAPQRRVVFGGHAHGAAPGVSGALAVSAARDGCVSRLAQLAPLAGAPDAGARRGGSPPGVAGPDHRSSRRGHGRSRHRHDPRAARETLRVRVRARGDSAGDFLDRAAFPHHRGPRPALPRPRRGEADHPRYEVLCCTARTRLTAEVSGELT